MIRFHRLHMYTQSSAKVDFSRTPKNCRRIEMLIYQVVGGTNFLFVPLQNVDQLSDDRCILDRRITILLQGVLTCITEKSLYKNTPGLWNNILIGWVFLCTMGLAQREGRGGPHLLQNRLHQNALAQKCSVKHALTLMW
jgi:hypothetical protein